MYFKVYTEIIGPVAHIQYFRRVMSLYQRDHAQVFLPALMEGPSRGCHIYHHATSPPSRICPDGLQKLTCSKSKIRRGQIAILKLSKAPRSPYAVCGSIRIGTQAYHQSQSVHSLYGLCQSIEARANRLPTTILYSAT